MTPRERVLVLGGAALMSAAGLARLAPALASWTARRVEVARRQSMVATRAEALVIQAPALQSQLAARAREIVTLAPHLLAGRSEAEGVAALGGELNVIAVRHRVTIRRVDAGTDSAAGPFARLQVRILGESDFEGVYGFVKDVESGPLLLSFASLGVGVEPGAGPMERLRLEAVVHGWIQRPAAPPAEPPSRPEAERAGGVRQ